MDREEILEEIKRNDMQLESLKTRLSGSNVYHYEQNLDARLKEIEDELKDDTQTEEARNKRYELRKEKDKISDLKRLRELQARQAELRKQLRGEEVVDSDAPTQPLPLTEPAYMEMWQNYQNIIIALETWKQKEQNLDRWMSNHYKKWEAGEIDKKQGDWDFDEHLNAEYKALVKEVDDAHTYFQEKDNGLIQNRSGFTDVLSDYYENKKKLFEMERRESQESWESNDKVKIYYKELKQEAEESKRRWYKTKADLWQLQVKEFCEEHRIDPNTLPEIPEVKDWIEKSVEIAKTDESDNRKTEKPNMESAKTEPIKDRRPVSKVPEPDFSGLDKIVADEEMVTDKDEEGTNNWSEFVNDASKIDKRMKEYDEFAKKHPRLAKIRDFFSKLVGSRSRDNGKTTKLHPIPTDVQSVKKTAGQLGNEFRSKIKTRTPVGRTTKIETENEKQHNEEETR